MRGNIKSVPRIKTRLGLYVTTTIIAQYEYYTVIFKPTFLTNISRPYSNVQGKQKIFTKNTHIIKIIVVVFILYHFFVSKSIYFL